MLTYQLHTRTIKITNGVSLSFPNRAVIDVKLSPPNAFGVDSSPGRTVVRGHKTELALNSNTGKWQALSDPPLMPLGLKLTTPNHVFSLQGDNLRIEFQCEDSSELIGTLMSFLWILPTLLNLEFADPPTVIGVVGTLGDSKFRWELDQSEWIVELWPKTEEQLENCVISSIERMSIFNGTQNRRLAAALRYFFVGTRLSVCGESSWEFMAETILNYAKSLEILFATSKASKDDVRRELEKIGYTPDEIELDFIPILELRRVDVAHPKVALFEKKDLQVLYQYIHHSESTIRRLLNRVVEMVVSGSYEIPQSDLKLDKEDQRHLRRLVEKMSERVEPTHGT